MALVFSFYRPAWHGQFVWDDDDYVTKNPLLIAPDGLRRIWFSLDSPSQYFPLTYTTFWVERRLWGLDPTGYHWINLLLHAANAALLWRLLVRLRIPGALLAAMIFALHPVQVESVAWITERKNVLMGFFFLLSLLSWIAFLESPNKRRLAYGLALLFFFLALTAKTTACTLPAALLLILWLQDRPIDRQRILQIAPFFLLGTAMGLVTIWWERFHIGTRGELFNIGLFDRLLIAGRGFWFYLGKLVWPNKLTFIYPQWSISVADPRSYLSVAAALFFAGAIIFVRRRLGRGLEVGFLFFLLTLAPTLGFIMLYTFRYTFVADHYQYLACIGPITLVAAGVAQFGRHFRVEKQTLIAATVIVATSLGVLTWKQSQNYRDLEALWRATIANNPDCWMAHSNLGRELLQRGQIDEAIEHFERVSAISPNLVEGHNNLGNALLQKGRTSEAVAQFDKVLTLSPDDANAQNNIGGILFAQGKIDEAETAFRRVLDKHPDYAEAHNNLGNVFMQRGRIAEAIAEYRETLKRPFDYAKAHFNLGFAYGAKGDVDLAISEYEAAIALRPDYAKAHTNLGAILQQRGRWAESLGHYETAMRADPMSILYRNNLAWMLATCPDKSLRDPSRALDLAEETLRASDDNNPMTLRTLAAALAANGRFAEAAEMAHRAIDSLGSSSATELRQTLQRELELYSAGQPCCSGAGL